MKRKIHIDEAVKRDRFGELEGKDYGMLRTERKLRREFEKSYALNKDVLKEDFLKPFTRGEKRNIYELVIPEFVKKIEKHTFSNCENLRTVTFPDGLTYLGDFCFNGCTNLRNIKFPESLTYLGDFCFDACFDISEITIPKSVKEIGFNAFSGTHLKKIIFEGSVPKLRKLCFGEIYSYSGPIRIDIILDEPSDIHRFTQGINEFDSRKFILCDHVKIINNVPLKDIIFHIS